MNQNNTQYYNLPDDITTCPDGYITATGNAFPFSKSLLESSGIGFGLHVECFPSEDDEAPVINCGNKTVIRCRQCRAYINPYAIFMMANTWKCNLCGDKNVLPENYKGELDKEGHRVDRLERPELSSCFYEFIAPSEYSSRVPQIPTFVFLIDVSAAAIEYEMPKMVCEGLISQLPYMAQNPRTEVAILTYDSSLHFYRLLPDATTFRMSVASDLDEVCLPLKDEIFLNVSEYLTPLMEFLETLPGMHISSTDSGSVLGTALEAIKALIGISGGKVLIYNASTPSKGKGALPPRKMPIFESSNSMHNSPRSKKKPIYQRGPSTDKSAVEAAKNWSDNEKVLLKDHSEFFTKKVTEFYESFISVDVSYFCPKGVASDVACLSVISGATGGKFLLYNVGAFGSTKEKVKTELLADMKHRLRKSIAWDSVMRIRLSKNLVASDFLGPFIVRNGDLLCMPSCSGGQTVSMSISFSDDDSSDSKSLNVNYAFFQSALLYTSSAGQRRIRVYNKALPVVSSISKYVKSIEPNAFAAFILRSTTKKVNFLSFKHGRLSIQASMSSLIRRLVSLTDAAEGRFSLQNIPENVLMLAVRALGMLKCTAFCESLRSPSEAVRNGEQLENERLFIFPQTRNSDFSFLASGTVQELSLYCSPLVFGLIDVICDEQFYEIHETQLISKHRLRLNSLALSSSPILVIYDCKDFFIRVSPDCSPGLLQKFFGVEEFREDLDLAPYSKESEDPYVQRLAIIIEHLQSCSTYRHVTPVVKTASEAFDRHCLAFLLEERTESVMSLDEFLKHLLKNVDMPYQPETSRNDPVNDYHLAMAAFRPR